MWVELSFSHLFVQLQLAGSMALTVHLLATLRRSCVKGYHVYGIGAVGDLFYCEREAHNPHSASAILVKKLDGSTVGHVPEGLAVIFVYMLENDYVTSIAGTITGPPRSAPTGTWSVGGGIELPCSYTLHGPKMYQSTVRASLKQKQRKGTDTVS